MKSTVVGHGIGACDPSGAPASRIFSSDRICDGNRSGETKGSFRLIPSDDDRRDVSVLQSLTGTSSGQHGRMNRVKCKQLSRRIVMPYEY